MQPGSFLKFTWELCNIMSSSSVHHKNKPSITPLCAIIQRSAYCLYSLQNIIVMTESWPDRRWWLNSAEGAGGISEELKTVRWTEFHENTAYCAVAQPSLHVFIVSGQNPLCKQTPVHLNLSVTTDSPITSLMHITPLTNTHNFIICSMSYLCNSGKNLAFFLKGQWTAFILLL